MFLVVGCINHSYDTGPTESVGAALDHLAGKVREGDNICP